MRAGARCFALAALCLSSRLPVAADDLPGLRDLATLDGASGYEGAVLDYVRKAVGGKQEVDNTGSLTVTFGSGAPRVLLVAGLDEPGYLVSAITPEGYLRVHRLSANTTSRDFDNYFLAQGVRVTTAAGRALNGVVAGLSVHLQSERGITMRVDHPEHMFIDIGARSEREAREAGVDLLDPITLEKSYAELGNKGRVTAPWISGRAGAAVLIGLARRLEKSPPAGTVTLAFVSQQYSGNQGLARVVERVAPEKTVWIKPGGNAKPAVAPITDRGSQVAVALADLAEKRGLEMDRGVADRVAVAAFASEEIWKNPRTAAALTLGVENAGSPVEVVSGPGLEKIANLLAEFAGIRAPAQPGAARPAAIAEKPGSTLESLINLFAVSGHEAPVRQAIVDLLPPWARRASRVDEKGNLIVAVGEKPERLFLSHMDELGFEVMEVEQDGKLWIETRGGGTPDFFEWHPGLFHTGSKTLPAILLGPEGEAGGASLRTELDIGAASAEEARAMGARLGATATVRKKWRPLLGSRVSARSLDDRAGCAVLLETLRSIKPEEIKQPTWFVFTVAEETGLHGAEFLAGSLSPKEVYAIDTFVSSDSPLESQRFAAARLGEGFVIRAMDTSGITPRAAVVRVAELARQNGIPVQYGVTSGANDGSKFVSKGAINVALGWPLRYSHSPVEVADLKDIGALAKIVRLLAVN